LILKNMQYISTYIQLSLKWKRRGRRRGRGIIRIRSINLLQTLYNWYISSLFTHCVMIFLYFILLTCLRSMFKLITKLVQPYAVVPSERKFIILFGAPGVGKSTYSKLLSNDLGLYHLSIESLICNALGFNKK